MSKATRVSPSARWAWWLVAVVLVASRLLIYFCAPEPENVFPYDFWFQEFQAATRHGLDLYAYHEQRARQELDELRRRGDTDPHGGSGTLEYPPLALAVVLLPGIVVDHLPEDGSLPADLQWRYAMAFRFEMLLFDLLAFTVVAITARRLFPTETPAQRAERLIVYLLATAALAPLLYNRIDMAMSALVVLSLGLLVGGATTFWPMLVLALAINYKVVPLVLAPWWALGTCPANWPQRPVTPARFLLPPLARLLLLAALVVGVFLPFALLYGERTLRFFAFHKDRGLEIESTYCTLLLALRPLGYPVRVIERYGGFDLSSPLSPWGARLAGVILAVLLAVAGGSLLVRLLRRPHQDAPAAASGRTLAQAYPHLFVAHTLLVLLVVVAANKVFSPQYMIWLPPLVVLASFERRPRLFLFGSLIALCLLTNLIFPVLFWKDVVGLQGPVTNPPHYEGPTLRGFVAMAARNLLLIVVTVWVAKRVISKRGDEMMRPLPFRET